MTLERFVAGSHSLGARLVFRTSCDVQESRIRLRKVRRITQGVKRPHEGIVGMKRRLGLHGNVVASPAPPLFTRSPSGSGAHDREANRHRDHRPGPAQARESVVHQSRRRHDHRPPHRHQSGAVHRRAGRAAAGPHPARGEHRERVGRPPPGVARPRGDRRESELRADVRARGCPRGSPSWSCRRR